MVNLNNSQQIVEQALTKLSMLGAHIVKSNETFAVYSIGNILYLLAVNETGNVLTKQISNNIHGHSDPTLTQNFAFIHLQKGNRPYKVIEIYTRNNLNQSISEITGKEYIVVSMDGFEYAMDNSKLPICIARNYNSINVIHYKNGIITGPISRLKFETHTEIGIYSLGTKYIKMTGHSGYYIGYGDIASFEMVIPIYKLSDDGKQFIQADREVQKYVLKRFMKKHLKRYNPNDYTIDKFGDIVRINDI